MIWTSLSLSDWQLALSPAVLFVSWKVLRVPALAVLCACAVILVLAAQARTYTVSARGGFLMARFNSDPNEFIAYQFRSEVNQHISPARDLRWSGERLARYPKRIFSETDALELLQADPRLRLVVWDTVNAASLKRSIRLSFGTARNPSLESLASGKLPAELLAFKYVDSIPAAIFSFMPEGESAAFLALLIKGFAATNPDESELRRELGLAALQDALRLEGFWTSYAHRAVAGFFLGNGYLRAALSEDTLSIGELECAIAAYKEALGSLRSGDNPELEAAVYNNLGIAIYLRAFWLGSNEEAKLASKAWRSAVKTLGQPNPFIKPFVAARIARQNFQLARAFRGQSGPEFTD